MCLWGTPRLLPHSTGAGQGKKGTGGVEAGNAAAAKSLQSCPTLCDLIDGSLSGSSVPRILQARVLEWVAIAFSRAGNAGQSQIDCCAMQRSLHLDGTDEPICRAAMETQI